MRIAINTRLLLKGKMDGIGWFTYETTRRIVKAHPEHTFYLLFDRKPAPEFLFADNVVPLVLCPPARHPILWWMFFELSVAMALKRHRIDLYVTPDGFMPLHPNVPTLSVIHDLNFEHATDNLRPSHQRYMTHFFPRYAHNATRIATVSTYSKEDIAETYHIDSKNIDVVYDGAHEHYRPHSEAEKTAVRNRFTDGKPYLIFISTILKRKNLANLLLAFDRVKDTDTRGIKLLVVGKRVWWQDELAEAYDNMRHRDDVLMPGRVEPEELSALLSAAEALVYPSYFEGFGIPILEAMYAETAVIASCTTSMPEVGGDAVLYVDPADPEDIAHAISRLSDSQLREELIAKGRTQRQKFSWDRTANLLWDSMKKTIKQS
ncbi:MAG: glycosyltransferase family 4 protein [Bacteroidales bacterium]|nr:glycosyltransferase family 4 protein [Bacteroidales bacterium]